MIWYLINQYIDQEKELGVKKMPLYGTVYIFMCIIASILYVTVSIYNLTTHKSPVIFIITIVSYAIVIWLSTWSMMKLTDKKVKKKKGIDVYKNKLVILKKILLSEDFNLYSENKIKEVIKMCDLVLESLKPRNDFFAPIRYIVTTVLIPLIVLMFNIITGTLEYDATLKLSVLIMLFILQLLGVYYLVSPMILDYLDKEVAQTKRVKRMLEDILVFDFIK